MPVRSANAIWEGSIGQGNGTMKMAAWEGPYSAASRFEEGEGTNPEELLAAAHAGCFSMALSSALTRGGTPPTKIDTTAHVHIEKLEEGWRVVKIELATRGEVPGLDAAGFQTAAEGAKENCPISKALGAVKEITVVATLV